MRRGLTAAHMITAALVFSLIPLAVNISGASQAPLLFNTYLRTGAATGFLIFLLAVHRRTLLNRQALTLARTSLFRLPTSALAAGALISTFDFPLLAWSANHIGIATASIIFQTGPVFVILLAQRLFRDRSRALSPATLLLIALGLAGLVTPCSCVAK